MYRVHTVSANNNNNVSLYVGDDSNLVKLAPDDGNNKGIFIGGSADEDDSSSTNQMLSQLFATFHITPRMAKDSMPLEVKEAAIAYANNKDDKNNNDNNNTIIDNDDDDHNEQQKYLLLALKTKCSVDVIQTLLSTCASSFQRDVHPENGTTISQAQKKTKKSFLELVIERLIGAMNNRLNKYSGDFHHHVLLSDAFLQGLVEDMEGQRLWSIMQLVVRQAAAADDNRFEGMVHAITAMHTSVLSDRNSKFLLKLSVWAYPQEVRQRSHDGKLPIHQAILSGKSLDMIQMILAAYPECALEKAQQEQDNHLYPCLLAATCTNSSLDVVYKFLLANSSLLALAATN